ncbi:MAG: Gfo/Idh/MocA family protein [Halosimplex sp.]
MTVAVGILSAAHVHTDAYAGLLADHGEAELVGVADDDAERGRETAARHDTEFLPAEELLSAADGAVVCSPNATHEAWVERTAEAGVDVLCEKPLAPTYEGARRIADTCAAAGVEAGVCMPMRFSPLALAARERYESEIGDLRFVSGTNRGKMPGGWFADPDLAGGGAVMDHTVHLLNLVRWYTGLEVAEVYAETGTRMHDVPVEDVNLLSMTLEDGTPFTLDGSWSRPDEWHTWGDVSLDLLGTEGSVGFDSTGAQLTHTDGDGVRSVPVRRDANEGLVDDFVTAVAEGRDPRTTVAEGATEVAVVEAAYESAERGEPVGVEY